MKKNILISLPFLRLTKLINENIIAELLSDYENIYIISPFDYHNNNERIIHIGWDENLNFVQYFLLRISDIFRRIGFFSKFRNDGFIYEDQKSYLFKKNNGKKYLGILELLLIYAAKYIGRCETSWRIIRGIAILNGNKNLTKIDALISKYPFHSIQFAQWGVQDLILSSYFEKHSDFKIFYTYSTDQCVNGFLMTKYNKIYLQGNKEKTFLLKYHKLERDCEVVIKNIWSNYLYSKINKQKIHKDIFLICGADDTFYPKISEINVIKEILYRTNILNLYNVVYRPILDDFHTIDYYSTSFKNYKKLKIIPPSSNLVGLTRGVEQIKLQIDIENYIELLQKSEYICSAFPTSLLIDGALVGAKVFSFGIDSTGYFERVDIYKSLKSKLDIYEGVNIFDNIDELIVFISSNELKKINNDRLVQNWS